MTDRVVRLAAVGDLHCARGSRGALQPLFSGIAEVADVLLLAGDLTDRGLAEEAHVLTGELAAMRMPTVAVLGNHDFESDQQAQVRDVLSAAGVTVLDGEACEVLGIGIAGVKGFAGGFGQRALGAWGETVVKQFVHEAVAEALKLEAALARLRTPQIVALLHYSPVEQTIVGEPAEIYPFIGSSRLEEPLNRYPVTAVVHGHAHRGQLQGATANGTPVYNVALPLLLRTDSARPFRLFELPVDVPGHLRDAHGHE